MARFRGCGQVVDVEPRYISSPSSFVPLPSPVVQIQKLPRSKPRHTPASISGTLPSQPAVVPQYVPQPVQPYRPPIKSQYERDLETAIALSRNQSHESGLSFAQIQDMANRELTPEDYELLLLLDSGLAKQTVSEDKLEALTETQYAGNTDTTDCTICMGPFEIGETLKHLPCKHFFHSECVSTWLSKHSKTCPLCNAVVN